MKKLLLLISFLFLTTLSAISADMRIIQVDELLYSASKESSTKNFENLINRINKEKNVDFIVFSGDNLAKTGKDNLKSFIKKAKSLKYPYYIVLGSKDISKQKDFGKKEYAEYLKKKVKTHKKFNSPNYVFEKNRLVFIVVDGSKEVIPTPMGYYRDDVLNWLDDQLYKYKDKKVIILQHYPIIPPAKKENLYTYKADEYLELLSRYSNVKAIISGHFGVNNEQTFNGVLHISTAKAPTYRIIDIIDFETEAPTFWSTIR